MARGLGGERPFPSAKVVDGKRRRLVEFVGNHERLGKNGRLFWHNIMEGKRPWPVGAAYRGVRVVHKVSL